MPTAVLVSTRRLLARLRSLRELRLPLAFVVAGVTIGPVTLASVTGQAISAKHQPTRGPETLPVRLEVGRPIQESVSRGQIKSAHVALAAGQYVEVTASPQGVAVALRILDPSGARVRDVENPYTSEGPVSALLVAEHGGIYRLDVEVTDAGGLSGRLSLGIDALRSATPDDAVRSKAQEQFMSGVRLREKGTAESLRDALVAYDRARELSSSIRDERAEALARLASGMAFYDLGDNPKALDASTQALPVFKNLGDLRSEAAALDAIGQAHDAIGDEHDALARYFDALQLRKQVGDRLAEAETLNDIGVAYDSLGEKRDAIDYFTQSLALKHALQLRRREGTSLNNLGSAYFTVGEIQQALECYRQALPLRQAEGDIKGQGVTLTNIGAVYLTLGDIPAAMAYFDQALVATRRAGNSVWLGTLYNNMGLAFFQSGEMQKAVDAYTQSLEWRRTAQDRTGEATTLGNLARVQAEGGDIAQSLATLDRALALIRTVGDKRWEANFLNSIGRAFLSKGDVEQSLASFERARMLAKDVTDLRAESVALFGTAKAKGDSGRLDESLAAMDAVLPIIDALRAKVASPSLRASYFATIREPYEFYVDLLMRMHRADPGKGYDARALEANERSRARTLLETLDESRTTLRAGADRELLAREQDVRQRIEGKRDAQVLLLIGSHTDAQAAGLKKELDDLLRQYEDIQGDIRAGTRYGSLVKPTTLSVAEIQRLLDPDTLLLEYALAEPRSYVWAITPEALVGAELPSATDISVAARRVYALLTDRNRVVPAESPAGALRRVAQSDAAWPEAAGTLSRIVLGPVASILGKKRLVIVRDGALQYVPFGALPVPAASSSTSAAAPRAPLDVPLIAEHEIVGLPSASVLASLRRDLVGRAPAPRAVAVLADPVFSPRDERVHTASAAPAQVHPTSASRPPVALSPAQERITRAASDGGPGAVLRFDRLAFTRREARAILAVTPKGTGFLAQDFDASRTTALSAELSRYRIVHIATHGVLDSEHPELSGVVLSLVDAHGSPQNGFLDLQDVYNLNLSADLVVLSACETALGREIRGEGLVGLTRGFMYAGAPRVVASLWNVQDAATATLMGHFYERMLRQGQRPAAALREAQIAMWRQGRWTPYHWAGFEIQGEWR
jgi:CHAT domain-containing protein/tetratricopeptide (TPR) repeat protein